MQLSMVKTEKLDMEVVWDMVYKDLFGEPMLDNYYPLLFYSIFFFFMYFSIHHFFLGKTLMIQQVMSLCIQITDGNYSNFFFYKKKFTVQYFTILNKKIMYSTILYYTIDSNE